jgi:hypothetical protein
MCPETNAGASDGTGEYTGGGEARRHEDSVPKQSRAQIDERSQEHD